VYLAVVPLRTLKVYGGNRGAAPLTLNLGTRLEWPASFHGVIDPYIHRKGGWVGPRRLDAVEKRNVFDSCLESNHDSSTTQPVVLSHYRLSCTGSLLDTQPLPITTQNLNIGVTESQNMYLILGKKNTSTTEYSSQTLGLTKA
jgi:hypothetical protein